jgi:hypothetical protein
MVSAAAAKKSAMFALHQMPDRAISHLIKAIDEGRLDGSSFQTCFYGRLAKSCEVPGAQSLDDAFAAIEPFYKKLGIKIVRHRISNPIEYFLARVKYHMTPETCAELAHLSMWCEEVLIYRRNGGVQRTINPVRKLINRVSVRPRTFQLA